MGGPPARTRSCAQMLSARGVPDVEWRRCGGRPASCKSCWIARFHSGNSAALLPFLHPRVPLGSEIPRPWRCRGFMLQSMDQQTDVEPSPLSSSFAGLLAALAAPKQEPQHAWNDDDLADDVATLSYERALRAHARYKPADFGDWALPQSADSAEASGDNEKPGNGSRNAAAHPATATARTPQNHHLRERAANSSPATAALEENRKRASVTLRMSRGEFAQLQGRAAEAGLTVSAYVRSCTFEAEALRAQVKEALARLQPVKPAGADAPAPAKPSRFGWMQRLIPRRRAMARRGAGA